MSRKTKPDYRSILLAEFERRRLTAPHLSHNAFAKFLGVSKSHLSQVMNGKYELSIGMAMKIADKLKMSQSQREVFLTSIENSVKKGKKTILSKRRLAGKMQSLFSGEVVYKPDNSPFELIAETALEAIRILKPAGDRAQMIQVLTQSLFFDLASIEKAIEWLIEHQMIEESEGSWKAKEITSISWDKIGIGHQHALSIGTKVLSSPQHWALSCGLLGIDKSRKPEAIAMLRDFAAKFVETFATFSDSDDIILLNAHIFSIFKGSSSDPLHG